MDNPLLATEKIKRNFAAILNASGYQDKYLAKKLGIHPSLFSVKKMRGNWKIEEIIKINEVMEKPNEEYSEALSLAIAESRVGGEKVSVDEYRKIISDDSSN